jgi:hypothetical protein
MKTLSRYISVISKQNWLLFQKWKIKKRNILSWLFPLLETSTCLNLLSTVWGFPPKSGAMAKRNNDFSLKTPAQWTWCHSRSGSDRCGGQALHLVALVIPASHWWCSCNCDSLPRQMFWDFTDTLGTNAMTVKIMVNVSLGRHSDTQVLWWLQCPPHSFRDASQTPQNVTCSLSIPGYGGTNSFRHLIGRL